MKQLTSLTKLKAWWGFMLGLTVGSVFNVAIGIHVGWPTRYILTWGYITVMMSLICTLSFKDAKKPGRYVDDSASPWLR